MKGCDKEVTTPFCPQCGKASSALNGLLQHVASKAGAARKQAKEHKERLASEPNHPHMARFAVKSAAVAEKWAAWEDALRAVIAGKGLP